MKKVITIIGIFGLIFVQAQVGINKDKPDATLDIVAEKTDGTQVEGLLVPRISKEAAYNMAIATTKPQESNLVYVNNANYAFPAGATDAQKATVADITEKGYYSWNGNKWELINTSGNSIWSKAANGVELNDSNLKDSIQYTKDGYRIFDKSKTMVNIFDVYNHIYYNISPVDSTNAYNYEQTLFKNITKKSKGYLSGKSIQAIATTDDTHPGTGMQALHASTTIDGNNTNNYTNVSGIFAGAVHNGSGKAGWLRGAYLYGTLSKKSKSDLVVGAMIGGVTYSDYDVPQVVGMSTEGSVRGSGNVSRAVGINATASHSGSGRVNWLRGAYISGTLSKNSKADMVSGAVSGAVTYSDFLTNQIIGSNIYSTVRGTGNVINLIGEEVTVGGDKVSSTSPDITATVTNLIGSRYILGKGGMKGTIENAYANQINYQVASNTPINNVYGLYVEDLPNHATGDKYAIYTKAGKVRLGDDVSIGTTAAPKKLEVNGAIKVGSDSTTPGIPSHAAPEGTIIYHNQSFYGRTSNGWKKLHN